MGEPLDKSIYTCSMYASHIESTEWLCLRNSMLVYYRTPQFEYIQALNRHHFFEGTVRLLNTKSYIRLLIKAHGDVVCIINLRQRVSDKSFCFFFVFISEYCIRSVSSLGTETKAFWGSSVSSFLYLSLDQNHRLVVSLLKLWACLQFWNWVKGSIPFDLSPAILKYPATIFSSLWLCHVTTDLQLKGAVQVG